MVEFEPWMTVNVGDQVEVDPYGFGGSGRWAVLGFSGNGFDDERGRIPAGFVHIRNLDDPTNDDWVHQSCLVPVSDN
jgi:hypothetical protein